MIFIDENDTYTQQAIDAAKTVYAVQNRKREYCDYTQVVACSVDSDETAVSDTVKEYGFTPADKRALKGLTPLWIKAGVRYWGYM